MMDFEVSDYDNSEGTLTHFALFSDYDPITLEDAVKELKIEKSHRCRVRTYI